MCNAVLWTAVTCSHVWREGGGNGGWRETESVVCCVWSFVWSFNHCPSAVKASKWFLVHWCYCSFRWTSWGVWDGCCSWNQTRWLWWMQWLTHWYSQNASSTPTGGPGLYRVSTGRRIHLRRLFPAWRLMVVNSGPQIVLCLHFLGVMAIDLQGWEGGWFTLRSMTSSLVLWALRSSENQSVSAWSRPSCRGVQGDGVVWVLDAGPLLVLLRQCSV